MIFGLNNLPSEDYEGNTRQRRALQSHTIVSNKKEPLSEFLPNHVEIIIN